MKAAQVGGTNNNGTPGGHSGLLGANANLPSSSPGPQGQNMMQGRIKMEGKNYLLYILCSFYVSFGLKSRIYCRL